MSFDRLAPFYRTIERIAAGGKLQRCRLAFLREIPAPRHVLLAGEGHGRFLPECRRQFPDAEITVIDASAKMLEIARTSVPHERINFIHADILHLPAPAGAFDLIVTHFFLDCFDADNLAAVVENLARAATPDAHWLLADFQIPAGTAARLRARAILTLLYRFFRLTCHLRARNLIPPDAHLQTAGFHRQARRTYDWGLLKSEWWKQGQC